MNADILVMAHRGASGSAPENTLAAFHLAAESGADFAELDVQLSLDGEVVVIHDLTLDRTTNLAGEVRDYTLSELQAADAGSWYAPQFADQHIPTLRQVMEMAGDRMGLNIEIKKTADMQDTVAGIIDLIHKLNFKPVIITSFAQPAIELARRINPDIATGLIFDKKHPKQQLAGEWQYLCAKYTLVDESFVQQAHAAGKKLLVWTVNTQDDILTMMKLGVDGIITNYPAKTKKLVMEVVI